MITIENAFISQIAHHRVSSEPSKTVLSDAAFEFANTEEEELFIQLFLKPFTQHAKTYEFTHEVSLEYNVLHGLTRRVQSGEDFISTSHDIAQHLLAVSTHPNIKDGDLFVVRFEGIMLGNRMLEGLGIYKFEEMESFFETAVVDNNMVRSFKKGLGKKKPEKGCLVLFTDESYTLLIIDNNKAGETDYWVNDFIRQKPRKDHINNTHDFLNITRDYITSQIQEDFEISKADQIDLLNKSVDYFKNHETFDKNEFEEQVFASPNVIQSFRQFNEHYSEENELELPDSFEISGHAVKKQARVFKSVLKLDKNFHIYIHGNRELIEQGIEPNGRKFYKIYYDEER